MKLVDVSVRRPVGVLMIVLAILALGFVSFSNLKVDLYPEVDLPIAVVATSYPGAGPEEVEKMISKPMEAALTSIEGVDTIQSQSIPSSSLVVLMFTSGTNLDNALLEVREKVDQVKGMLPADGNDPSVLRFDPQQMPVMWLGLVGDDIVRLQDIAEETVQPLLERAEGVASVSIEGGKKREIRLELDRAKLALYKLTPNQVVQALQAENRSASGGTITKGGQDLQIRIDGEFTSLDDINNTLISLPTGGHVKVSDVATLNDTYKKQTSVSVVNNESSLVLSVLKKSDGNTVEVADEVYESMEKINEQLPEGIKIINVFDTSTFIRDSISSVSSNMITGGLLAIFVLLVFLRSMRPTLVIAVSIPFAVIATFVMMYFAGQTLNVLSLGGLALGVGMMVDNSIVILENIFNYRQRGASVKEAAIKGASELGSAVVASTTTSLVVFLPIVFVDGIASELFTPLALAVSFSLIGSLAVAITLVPVLASKLLTKPVVTEKTKKSKFIQFFERFYDFYKKTLDWALRHRKTTVGVTILLLIGSLTLTPFLGAEAIPASDQGQLQITFETPSGTTLEETNDIANQIAERMEPYKEILETNYLSIGASHVGGQGNTNFGNFQIQLVKKSERDLTTDEFVNELSKAVEDIAGAEIKVAEMSAGLSSGKPISISIQGAEQDILEEIAEQITWVVEDVEGTTNVESSISEGRPEIRVEVNKDVAAQYGVTYQQVMSEVEVGFNGRLATVFREDGSEYDVRVILPEEERVKISDLENMFMQTPNGTLLPLSAVAELKQLQGPAQITRENQQRQINVSADISGRDLGSITRDITLALESMNFPEGYSYSMGGEVEQMNESFSQLALALVFSIFLVYVVMAVQFESLINPFVIMFAMPTTIVGIIFGLFITGQPFSIPAFIGVIMLAGIVVNNAIVLVDYINILRSRGMERTEAILQAGPTRLRPILMTTLTTVLGMIPLALGFGEGGEAQIPLAVVIIFGLSASMCFTLLFVPVMYTILEDNAKWLNKFFKKIGGKIGRIGKLGRKNKQPAEDTPAEM
ncbi:efflux RND transporter permease subunit [Calidifontibacillus oryziterrae]|uniref:efflux RND transporter permease subunit n=1 Tax=Calidifontibacillus oryziterrae TaxID=1191699 RepID=UPI0002D6295A|nr:efflux RND transporter permease subunit [Calidifontibacillus oryziterrae]